MPTALVTGASTGIGRATALRLDREGWDVLAGVRRTQDGDALRADASRRLRTVIVDVTDTASIAAAAGEVGERLDGLVNNAGIAVGGPVETVPLDDLRRQLEVNLVGQVAVTQAMLPALRAARGRIAFLSSVGGRVATPFVSPYSASKYAIEAVADALRVELAPFGVQVALIAPGAVATPIWDKGDAQARAAGDDLTPEMRDLYGPAIDALARVTQETGARGVAPEKVAAAIHHALTARRPRARYAIGIDARAMVRLRRTLPTRVWDRVLARAMHLPR
jgi:NAD(P)-dependent dehydrogenase (short-subunit alcohol dehydrogenase family)